MLPHAAITHTGIRCPAQRPFDVAVVIPTILRPSLLRAVASIYRQAGVASIQVLLGIDRPGGDRTLLDHLARHRPGHCALTVLDLGYSTSARNGGLHPAGTGGALRTILSYAAHSRYVAYLDDDNWWHENHLASLLHAVAGHDWAWSLRWYADDQQATPLCIDRWESVGPGAGVYRKRFGGFVDPGCLLIDKIACESVLRLWCLPLPGDRTAMSTDRPVFAYLHKRKRHAGTGLATAYYTIQPSDCMHRQRLRWIDLYRRAAEATPAGSPDR
jgi:hypothetical protein